MLSDDKKIDVVLPSVVHLEKFSIVKDSKIKLVDLLKEKIQYKANGSSTDILIDKKVLVKSAGKYAVVFEITQ